MLGGFHFEYIYDVADDINEAIQLIQSAAAHINIVINTISLTDDQITKAFRDIFHVRIKRGLKLITVKNPTVAELDHYRRMEADLILEQRSPDLVQWLLEN